MNIQANIETILKRLLHLGYRKFQIKRIIDEAIGQRSWTKNNYDQNVKILAALDKYEKLGSNYLLNYSK